MASDDASIIRRVAEHVVIAMFDGDSADVPWVHNGYLKRWTLFDPPPDLSKDFDLVLLDEAQAGGGAFIVPQRFT